MRCNKFVTLALSVLCIGIALISASPTLAQKGAKRAGQRIDQVLANMGTTLNLTDDQKAKIRPILETYVTQVQSMRKDPTITPQDRKSKTHDLGMTAMSQIKPILTAEQVQKVESMRGQGLSLLAGPRNPETPKAMLARMDQVLTLTEDQKSKIMPILQTQYTKSATLRSDTTLTPDQRKAQMKDIHTTAQTQIAAILTPDQQQKWTAYQQQMRERARNRNNGGAGTSSAPRTI